MALDRRGRRRFREEFWNRDWNQRDVIGSLLESELPCRTKTSAHCSARSASWDGGQNNESAVGSARGGWLIYGRLVESTGALHQDVTVTSRERAPGVPGQPCTKVGPPGGLRRGVPGVLRGGPR